MGHDLRRHGTYSDSRNYLTIPIGTLKNTIMDLYTLRQIQGVLMEVYADTQDVRIANVLKELRVEIASKEQETPVFYDLTTSRKKDRRKQFKTK